MHLRGNAFAAYCADKGWRNYSTQLSSLLIDFIYAIIILIN